MVVGWRAGGREGERLREVFEWGEKGNSREGGVYTKKFKWK
jgi:hypothetical protein